MSVESKYYKDWGYFPGYVCRKNSPYHDAFEHELCPVDSNCQEPTICKNRFKLEQGRNLASYIPLLNIYLGVKRIKDALSRGATYPCRTQMIVRGVSEILLGPALILVDAIVTLYRMIVAAYHASKQTLPKPKSSFTLSDNIVVV